VIDADGRIAWSHVSTTGFTYQKADRIAEVLRALPAPTTAYPDDKLPAPRRTRARKPTA
jgi:hypothetical protein